MAEKTEQPPIEPPIDLKDPVVAGLLAWLFPGAGHFYQGRWAKGVLFLVWIFGMFLWGLYLSSSPATGPARAVYFSFRTGDWRLYYLGQVGVGLPALPALLQAAIVGDEDGAALERLHGPAPPGGRPDRRAPGRARPRECTVADVYDKLNRWFELASVYTLIAGLLNILAVYDACCGPVVGQPPKKKAEKKLEEMWGTDLWYVFPPVISASLVYAATRHERMPAILRHAFGVGVRIVALMAVILAILMAISLSLTPLAPCGRGAGGEGKRRAAGTPISRKGAGEKDAKEKRGRNSVGTR